MSELRQLFDADWIKRALSRMAQQIVEENGGAGDLVIVGLHTHGVFLAERLARAINQAENTSVPVGTMDITLYRDDLGMQGGTPHLPKREGTRIPFDIADRIVILVDDVLNTGRSTRAALDQLMDLGRPRKIQLAGLIDRGGRELPIAADFVGHRLVAEPDRRVQVRLKENDGEEGVYSVKRKA